MNYSKILTVAGLLVVNACAYSSQSEQPLPVNQAHTIKTDAAYKIKSVAYGTVLGTGASYILKHVPLPIRIPVSVFITLLACPGIFKLITSESSGEVLHAIDIAGTSGVVATLATSMLVS